MPAHTVETLDGTAWAIDFEGQWYNLSTIPRIVYTLGDIVCHQKQNRSYTLNSNQMPVCARDIGLLFGLAIGFSLGIPAEKRPHVLSTACQLMHLRRLYWATALMILLLGPMIIDGLFQNLTTYESTNLLRTTTGLLFGIGLAIGVNTLILTDPRLTYQKIESKVEMNNRIK